MSFDPGHGYETLAATLGVYEALNIALRSARSLVDHLLLPLVATTAAIALWPRWTRPWRVFAGVCVLPFTLLAAGVAVVFLADAGVGGGWFGDLSKIERRGVIGWSMAWYLVEPLYIIPGAMVAVWLRQTAWWRGGDGAPEEADAGPDDPALAKKRLQDERGVAIRHGFIAGLALTAISFAVFCFVNTQPHPNVLYFNKLLSKYPVEAKFPLILGRMLSALLMEEFAWRALFQTAVVVALRDRLGRRGAVLAAILLSSFFWTITHPRNFNFAWAKYLHIFPLGLLLGWLMEKRGLMSCVVAHALLNAITMMFKLVGGDFVGLWGYEKPMMLPLDDFPLPGEE